MSLYTFDQVTIIGKVGKDAEMRYLPTGTAVTSFSMAADRSYKDRNSGEWIKRTIWYRISVFGNFAETCNGIKKGEAVFVQGELDADWQTGAPRVWNKQDGTAAASFEVRAQTVRFLTPREAENMLQAAENLGGVPEDDMPF